MLVWSLFVLGMLTAGWGRMTMALQDTPLEQYLENQQEIDGEKRIYGYARGRLSSCVETDDYFTMELRKVTVDLENTDAGSKRNAPEGRKETRGEYTLPGLLVTAPKDALEDAAVPLSGDELLVYGSFEPHAVDRNPGGFDSELYYKGKKLSCRLKARSIRRELRQGEGETAPVYLLSDFLKALGKEAFDSACCREDSGLFYAVIFGDKSGLSEETEELFQENGIAHILAVSGLHVSLIGMSCYRILRGFGLGYGAAGLWSSVLLFIYGTVTGFGSSIFRAVCMVLCSFGASRLGRTYDMLSAMALSLFFLVLDSPLLLCSGGLQLSYAAVLAVGLEAELRLLKRRREGKQKEGLWKNAFFMGLRIQLMTLPAVLYHYYCFPLWGIFLNLLVIPLMSYAAVSGLSVLGFYGLGRLMSAVCTSYAGERAGGFFLSVSGAMAGPGHYIFSFYRILCEGAEKLPLSSVPAGRPDWWKLLLYYLILFALYAREFYGENSVRYGRKKAVITAGICCLLLVRPPVFGLQVWFLDVGQGDCAVFRCRDGVVLSDCGSSQNRQVGKRCLVPFLQSRGIAEIDYVLVSHCDMDHVNGIQWLLEEEEKIAVKTLVLPLEGKGKEEYLALERAALLRGSRVCYVSAGDGFSLGDLEFTCLHPSGEQRLMEENGNIADEGEEEDINGHSLVFEVLYGEFSLLLTGDIGSKEEQKLLAYLKEHYLLEEKRITVLKTAHHGSGGSSSEEFLEMIVPEQAVISYGAGNSYGHPAPEVLDRLEAVHTDLWETAKEGAVLAETDGSFYTIQGYLSGREKAVDK